MLGGVSVAHTAESALRGRIEGRWELIRGGVHRMSPVGALHGTVVLAVGERVRSFVRRRRMGVVLVGDPGFILRRAPDTVRAPDVAFVRRGRLSVPPPDCASLEVMEQLGLDQAFSFDRDFRDCGFRVVP